MNLQELFHQKLTENGDVAFSSTGNVLLDIFFMSEYYQKHLDEVPNIGTSDMAKLFAMFIRDPRFGLGRRDLGRNLMNNAGCSIEQTVKAGRVDDLFYSNNYSDSELLNWLKEQIMQGNELVKKWMPRYSSKDLMSARFIASKWGMNKQQYGHFIKCNTTENKLSRKAYEEIDFEKVPSLAAIKYAKCFSTKPELAKRYQQYLSDVKSGKKELHVSTTTVYDIYRNRESIDPDLFFSKIEKISGSWIPIVDTSGSMWDNNDSIGKALSIGHYLAKCSTYCPNQVVSFSSKPQLITLGTPVKRDIWSYCPRIDGNHQYDRELDSMYTGDCSNTNFGKVMELSSGLDGDMPEWLIVLTDCEFDQGSKTSKDATMQLFKLNGYKTRIVWWNFNSRNTTTPEMDSDGNVFISGYNPMLLKFLQVGFDGPKFLQTLLEEYKKNIQ